MGMASMLETSVSERHNIHVKCSGIRWPRRFAHVAAEQHHLLQSTWSQAEGRVGEEWKQGEELEDE